MEFFNIKLKHTFCCIKVSYNAVFKGAHHFYKIWSSAEHFFGAPSDCQDFFSFFLTGNDGWFTDYYSFASHPHKGVCCSQVYPYIKTENTKKSIDHISYAV